MNDTCSIVRVLVATPLGAGGRGGMDRLTDLVIGKLQETADLRVEAAHLVTRGSGGVGRWPWVFAQAMAQLWLARRRAEVNLLHINLAADGSAYRKLVLARMARRLGIPYVVHLHGSRFDQFWPSTGAWSRRAIDRLFVESAEIVVLGRYWAKLVTDRLPQVADKVSILPNATAPAPAGVERSRKTVHICFLGILGARKGTWELVEALGRLAGSREWSATIAGNGEVDECRARVGRLEIADRVDVPGWLDPRAVEELLARADILVLPSKAENLPMAILEAFARGIAVVATPVGAIPEVIDHGRNGLIVSVGDVEQLAGSLGRLISDRELRHSLGAAAKRDHSERYEIGGYVARLAAIWRHAATSSAA
jgi:glycosyltransferase involved in cell wall biosynthesis